jgi:hypothetical protein
MNVCYTNALFRGPHFRATLRYLCTQIHVCTCIYKEFVIFLRLDKIRAMTENCLLRPIDYSFFLLLTNVTSWNITSQNRAGRFLKQTEHASQ